MVNSIDKYGDKEILRAIASGEMFDFVDTFLSDVHSINTSAGQASPIVSMTKFIAPNATRVVSTYSISLIPSIY